MSSLSWSLFLFVLLVTMWSNLFIYLRPAGCVCSSQSLFLDSEESYSDSSLEEFLISLRRFLVAFTLIFLIFLISRLLLIESLKISFTFTFRPLILFHIFSPTSHISSQSIIDGFIVGALSKTFISTMRHIISLEYSWFLAKHAIFLVTGMFGRLVVGSLVSAGDTIHCLLLPQYPNRYVTVRMSIRFIRSNLLGMILWPFPIIFDLYCGQEVTPIFMGQGKTVLLIFIQLILHGWGETVLNCNLYLIHREFGVADFPISYLIDIAFQGTIFLFIVIQLILHGWGETVLNCKLNLIHR